MDEPSRQRVPWTMRDIVCAILATLALLLLIIGLYAWFLFWEILPKPSGLGLLVLMTAAETLMLVTAWWWGPRRYGGGWHLLGLRGFAVGRGVVTSILAFGLLILINLVWSIVETELGLPGQPELVPLFGNGWQALLFALLVVGVVAPLVEELFFRGYLYAGLRQRFGRRRGMLLSAGIFAIAHVLPGTWMPIFLMGWVLAYVYERTDSLWPAIVIHGLMNTMALALSYVAT